MRIPLLSYDTMNIAGTDYALNPLCALASDIRLLTAEGFKVLPLSTIVNLWLENRGPELDGKLAALISDNGADFDYFDLSHPVAGPQRSVINILQDFREAHPREQQGLNITSFVIMSPEARALLDSTCMLGKGWWTDEWWPEAIDTGLMHISNHGWTYNHDTLPAALLRSSRSGTFLTIDSKQLADYEIRTGADYLRTHADNPGAAVFAYPYGESNPYLTHEYFPRYGAELGIRAAVVSRPDYLEPGTGRWELPRFTHGRDWRSPEDLKRILDAAAGRHPWVPVEWPTSAEDATTQDAPKPIGLRAFAQFIATRVEPIQGWLHPESALLTAHLLGIQGARQIVGPLLEIGVYKGKYLSLLYEASQPQDRVIGVDLFIGASDASEVVKVVKGNIEHACGDASRLDIIVGDSVALTGEQVVKRASGDRFRFVSIDGGHTPEIVTHDLETAYSALCEGGIIAIDDIFNPGVPGVVEGVAAFFLRNEPKLAPFAYCYNKLFVTTPGFHAAYLADALAFLDQVTWLPTQQRTLRSRADNHANSFVPKMFGYEVLSFL